MARRGVCCAPVDLTPHPNPLPIEGRGSRVRHLWVWRVLVRGDVACEWAGRAGGGKAELALHHAKNVKTPSVVAARQPLLATSRQPRLHFFIPS